MNARIKLPARLLARVLKVEPIIGGLLTATFVDAPPPRPPVQPAPPAAIGMA